MRYCTITLQKDGRPSEMSTHPMGEEGDFGFRVERRRCGQFRAAVVTIAVSDNVKRDLLALSVEMDGEAGR